MALLVAITIGSCSRPPADARTGNDGWRGTRLETSLARPDFTLEDTRGEPFAFREQTAGTLTFLFFGYTNCPDVCPVHMAGLGRILEQFPHAVRSRVRVVFVSTDPARDSPQRIREWLDEMGRGFVGLRGPLDEVNRIQIALGLPPASSSPAATPGTDYAVGHAAQVLAFTPDDSAHFAYPFGTRQEDWVRDLPRLLREFGGEE
ncbi:MAG: SCO family protein [Longimicrobiales bacterium]